MTRERAQKWLQQGSAAAQLQASGGSGSTSASSSGSLLKTGDEGIDEVLGGGLRPGTLTEFAGEAYVELHESSKSDSDSVPITAGQVGRLRSPYKWLYGSSFHSKKVD